MRTEHIQDMQSVEGDDASGPPSQSRPQSRSNSAVPSLARFINPLVLKLAGRRLLPLYGVIEHRGRRSGKLYRTPVVVWQASEGFIVPMPWGEGTDWYRNVRAASECVIRWKGRTYQMVQPELIAPAEARGSFSAIARAFSTRFGIKQYLHLRLRI
jgi:deazaflavin-dependent oxidoreductase (nitroreductase family)